MIARLAGRVVEREPNRVIVDIGGLGYRVSIPLSTFYTLPPDGEDVVLRIHTYVKEETLALYGFATREELAIFERLIDISGIGPRLAIAILSGLPVRDLIEAISTGDAARLRTIPGVGPRTADRVVLELRDRIKSLIPSAPAAGPPAGGDADRTLRTDVISALVNLGYRENQAGDAVGRALESFNGRTAASARGGADGPALLRDVLKRSLRYLAS